MALACAAVPRGKNKHMRRIFGLGQPRRLKPCYSASPPSPPYLQNRTNTIDLWSAKKHFVPLGCFKLFGRVAERSKAHAWKACEPAMAPRVRIPPLPHLGGMRSLYPEGKSRLFRQDNARFLPGFYCRLHN